MLVVDNCEHLLPAVRDLVATLLAACPSLHILATSRQPLDLAGEVVLRLGPLAALDDRGRPGPAVELFMRRTRDRGSHVEFDDASIEVVVDVCRRLDGLPLAVELAAARTTALTPCEIGERLGENLEILRLAHPPIGGLPRHQTLRAAIAWSYDLLEPDERRLFDDLAVFAGSFGLDAIEDVTTLGMRTAATALDTLEALVDRSLVVADDTPAGTRYRLLDTIRRFAAEQLEQRGDGRRIRGRHARWYEAVAVECGHRGPHQRPAHGTADGRARAGQPPGRLRASHAPIRRRRRPAARRRRMVGRLVDTDRASSRSGRGAPCTSRPNTSDRPPRQPAPSRRGEPSPAATTATPAAYRTGRSRPPPAGSYDDGLAANVAAVQSMFTRLGRDQAAVIADAKLDAARLPTTPNASCGPSSTATSPGQIGENR